MKELRGRISSAIEADRKARLTELARTPDLFLYGTDFKEILTEQQYGVQLRSLATLLHSDFGVDKPDNIGTSRDEDGTIYIHRLFNGHVLPWQPFSHPEWQLFTVQITPGNRLKTSRETRIGDEGLKEELKEREYMAMEDERQIGSITNHKSLDGLDPEDKSFLTSISHIEKLIDYMQNKLVVKTANEQGVDDLRINYREGNLLQFLPKSRRGSPIIENIVLLPKKAKELLPIFIETCRQNPQAMLNASYPLERLYDSEYSRPLEDGELSLKDALGKNGLMSLRIRAILKLNVKDFQLSPEFKMAARNGAHEIVFYNPTNA